MPQYGFNENGELEIYSEYTIKGISTTHDLFPKNAKTSKLLKIKNKQHFRDVYNMADKSAAVRRIFYDFLTLVLNELANGGMLVFPGKTGANISLKKISDESVKRLSREGKLVHIDIIKSGYIVPCFKFDFGPHSARSDRFIKVPLRIWKKAFINAENKTIKYTWFRKIRK